MSSDAAWLDLHRRVLTELDEPTSKLLQAISGHDSVEVGWCLEDLEVALARVRDIVQEGTPDA